MSQEQPPQDDDREVAEYQRADASKFPTTPGGQQAAVEGALAHHPDDSYQTGRTYSSVEIARRIKGRRRLQPSDSTRALAERLLAEVIQHERDTAARRAAQGDTNPYDTAPYSDVHDLAEMYDQARADDDPAALDRFLDHLADDLDLADVRALRTAAAAVADAMGRIALTAREGGMSPDRIAADTGYTASRIAQFIREERQRRADGAQ